MIDDIILALKHHLAKNAENFVYVDPYADGDTDYGFIAECAFDLQDLWNEIDTFCETFKDSK